MDRDKVIQMKKDRYGVTEIAKTLDISRRAVYNILESQKT
ncbi:helix-turn-helix domain-containing protein [Francisella philomiragia]